jgi:hypothetical protein
MGQLGEAGANTGGEQSKPQREESRFHMFGGTILSRRKREQRLGPATIILGRSESTL